MLAFVFGYLAFRSRVTGVYLSIITQALSYALLLAFFRNDMGFGGNNGFTDFKDILGFNLQKDSTRVVLVVLSALALAASYHRLPGARGLTRRPRDPGDSRCREPHALSRLSGRVVQAVAVGVLGHDRRCGRSALRAAGRASSIRASSHPLNSIEVVIWVAVGGRGTLHGAALGAILVNYAKTYSHRCVPRGLALRTRHTVRPGHSLPATGSGRALAVAATATAKAR